MSLLIGSHFQFFSKPFFGAVERSSGEEPRIQFGKPRALRALEMALRSSHAVENSTLDATSSRRRRSPALTDARSSIRNTLKSDFHPKNEARKSRNIVLSPGHLYLPALLENPVCDTIPAATATYLPEPMRDRPPHKPLQPNSTQTAKPRQPPAPTVAVPLPKYPLVVSLPPTFP